MTVWVSDNASWFFFMSGIVPCEEYKTKNKLNQWTTKADSIHWPLFTVPACEKPKFLYFQKVH